MFSHGHHLRTGRHVLLATILTAGIFAAPAFAGHDSWRRGPSQPTLQNDCRSRYQIGYDRGYRHGAREGYQTGKHDGFYGLPYHAQCGHDLRGRSKAFSEGYLAAWHEAYARAYRIGQREREWSRCRRRW